MTTILKQRIKWIIPLITFSIVMVIFFKTNQLENMVDALKQIKPIFIGVAILLIMGYWLFEAYILYRLIKHSEAHLSFSSALKITLAGQFFNGITPFASGGQPAQLYMLHKHSIPIGTGASVLTRKFIIYQAALVVYSLIVVAFESAYFMHEIPHFAFLGLVGFAVNLMVISVLLLLAYRYKFTMRLAIGLARFIRKRTKRLSIKRRCTHTLVQLRNFHAQMDKAREKRTAWFVLGFLSMLQLTLFFSIPLVIGYGFHLTNLSIFYMIGAAAFVSMITAFIPIPGAALGAEGSFFLVYQIFFPSKLVITALLLWRIFTYYMPLLVGGTVVMILKKPIAISNQMR
jgi:hypothetical protein